MNSYAPGGWKRWGEYEEFIIFSLLQIFITFTCSISNTWGNKSPQLQVFNANMGRNRHSVCAPCRQPGRNPGLAPWAPPCPTPRGMCVRDAPAEPAPSTARLRDHGDTSDFCSALPRPSHTAPNDLPIIIITTKAVEMLAFFPYRCTGWRLMGCKRLQGDLVPGTEPLLCCPSAAKAGSPLSPTRTGCSMWPSPSTTGSHPCCSHHTLLKSKLIEIISASQPIHKSRINKAGSMTLIYQ